MAIQNILDTTRRHLGELGVMSEQTQRAERKILTQAEKLLGEVDQRIKAGRGPALAGDAEASKQYQADILERGRLERVIAQATQVLKHT